jgi:hypothetical protein
MRALVPSHRSARRPPDLSRGLTDTRYIHWPSAYGKSGKRAEQSLLRSEPGSRFPPACVPLCAEVCSASGRFMQLVKGSASTYGWQMRGISIRAIALATLAVFGIDFLSGMVLVGVFGGPPMNATEEQIRAAVAALNANSNYLLAALVLGTASTVIGGYLTARLARSVPYFNAFAFGALAVLLGIPMSADLPTWFRVVGLGLTIPAALLGGYLSKRRTGPN